MPRRRLKSAVNSVMPAGAAFGLVETLWTLCAGGRPAASLRPNLFRIDRADFQLWEAYAAG
jgi:hypothetical protein